MDGYSKTTGKKYEDGELVKCSGCGEVYCPKEGNCPSCGSAKASKFQRTLATAKEEKEATYE